MARAIRYVRASKYEDGGTSPEIQFAAIDRHLADQGDIVVETIQDLDLSGRFWQTRDIERAVKMIERGEADKIVVWKVSRVARNLKDWAIAVDRVEGVGGRIESATEHFDASATGGLMRGQMALYADFESKRIGEGWKETHARRVGLGLTPHGAEQFGYVKHKDGYEVHPETGPVLRQLYMDFLAGKGMRALAELSAAHGGPSTSAGVRQMLDRGFGAGLVRFRKELVQGSQEPVISEAEFKRYQAERRQRAKRPRAESSQYPYSGLVFCECGKRMSGNAPKDRRTGEPKPRYICHAVNSAEGHINTVSQEVVEAAVLDELGKVALEVNERATEHQKAPRKTADARPKILRDLSKVLARIDSLTERWLDGDIEKDTHDRLLAKYKEEREALQERLDALDAQAAARGTVAVSADLLARWPDITADRKRGIVRALIARIEVPKGRTRWNPQKLGVFTTWE
jgi:DNA invertase Pin-like site-specific DNA recombinase